MFWTKFANLQNNSRCTHTHIRKLSVMYRKVLYTLCSRIKRFKFLVCLSVFCFCCIFSLAPRVSCFSLHRIISVYSSRTVCVIYCIRNEIIFQMWIDCVKQKRAKRTLIPYNTDGMVYVYWKSKVLAIYVKMYWVFDCAKALSCAVHNYKWLA